MDGQRLNEVLAVDRSVMGICAMVASLSSLESNDDRGYTIKRCELEVQDRDRALEYALAVGQAHSEVQFMAIFLDGCDLARPLSASFTKDAAFVYELLRRALGGRVSVSALSLEQANQQLAGIRELFTKQNVSTAEWTKNVEEARKASANPDFDRLKEFRDAEAKGLRDAMQFALMETALEAKRAEKSGGNNGKTDGTGHQGTEKTLEGLCSAVLLELAAIKVEDANMSASGLCPRALESVRQYVHSEYVAPAGEPRKAHQTLLKLWRAVQTTGVLERASGDVGSLAAKQLDFSEYPVLAAIYLANELDEHIDRIAESLPFGGGLAHEALSWTLGKLMGVVAYEIVARAESNGDGLPLSSVDTTRAACRHYSSGHTRPVSTMSMLRGMIVRFGTKVNSSTTTPSPTVSLGVLARRRVERQQEQDDEKIKSEIRRLVPGIKSANLTDSDYRLPIPVRYDLPKVARRIADVAASCDTIRACNLDTLNSRVSVDLAVRVTDELLGEGNANRWAMDELQGYDNGLARCCRREPLPLAHAGAPPVVEFLLDRSGSMLEQVVEAKAGDP